MAEENTALTTTEDVEVLPAPLDDEAIERVVVRLKNLHRGATLELALGIGRIIVEDIYGGDLEAWKSRGVKDASFSKLAARDDLEMSRSTLQRAASVYALCQGIGVSTWKHLGVSHLRVVLGLPKDEQHRLLTQAENKKWTVAQLEEAARGNEKPQRGGRPRSPSFVKALRRLEKVAVDEALFGDLEQLEDMKDETVDALLVQVQRVQAACERLQERLRARAGGEE